MKARLSLLVFLSLALMTITPQYAYSQSAGGHIKRETCTTCGKLKQNCPYKGNHPKPTSAPTPAPTTGTLSISSTPSDAVVKIDGEYMGTTPLTLKNRKAGTYKVTFSAEGYETQTKSVTVTAGKTATCSATLKKKQAQQPVVQQPVQQPVVQQPTTTATTSDSSQTITVNGISFKMVRVEGGTFTMGATPEQGSDAEDDEKPTHKVTLSTYYIGETEVTQALWEAVMGSNPSKFKGENRPVEEVNWDDCKTFISKLNSITGRNFRLPTEAEWEYAARGGNKSQGYKYSGSNTFGDVAWYNGSGGSGTHPVKTKSPNELGLYDMSGNVWEWCQDWYGDYSSSSQTNPTGPSSGSYRVHRGGSSYYDFRFCRVSRRNYFRQGHGYLYIGLRLAL